MLLGVERRGLGFDVEYSTELGNRILGEKERVEAQIPFNPRSHVQVKKYFSEFQIQLPNTQEDTLVHMQGQLPEGNIVRTMVDRILEVRGYTKMLGTYITGLQEKVTENGTIHPSFLLHGTTTGRLSSRNPNAQNIPRAKELKRQFIPSHPDHVLIQCDYSQAELRVLAWLAKEDTLRAIFNDPSIDIFVNLCQRMVPGFDQMSDVAKKEARTLIKTFAYGVSYGRTAHGIASDPKFGATVKEAQAFMNLFTAGIPNVMEFQADVRKRIHAGKDLINPFGRHRRFYLITEQNRTSVENEAMAYLPQSTASDICLEAACRVSAEGIQIRNLVHDAILAEAHRDEAQEVQARIQFHMAQVGKEITDDYVNFDTDGKIGMSWAEV
jgi:DNA polymerase-1